MFSTFDPNKFDGEVWVTADLHFGHQTVLDRTERPWKNVDRMDNALIRNLNECVGENDLLIINGDLMIFGPDRINYLDKIIGKIPGKKVLVFGNHDKLRPMAYLNLGFCMAATSLILPDGVLISHDPADAQAWPKDKPVVCGHIHELFQVLDNVVNVGVDVHGYYPVRLKDALSLCSKNRGEQDWRKISEERHKENDDGKRT